MYYKELYTTRPEPIRINVAQGSNAVPMMFRIMDWTIPAGAGTNIYMKKPSGAVIYNAGTVEDNAVIFDMTTQMTAEVGVNLGQIEIIKDTAVFYSWLIEIKVSESIADPSAPESTDEFTALQTRIAEADDAIETMTQWVAGFIQPYQYGGVNYLPGTANPSYAAVFQNTSYTANGTATWGAMPITQIDAPGVGAIFDCTAADNTYRHDLQYTVTLPVGRGTYQFTCFAYSTESSDEFSISADSQYVDWIKDAYGEHSDHPAQAYGRYDNNTAPNALQKNLCVFEKTTAQALTVTFSIGMPYSRVETLYLCGFQLERAAAPSDWRPAIGDIIPSGSWTAPTPASSRCTITSGGYKVVGNKVIVRVSCSSTYDRSLDTINDIAILTGLPPAVAGSPLNCINSTKGVCVPCYKAGGDNTSIFFVLGVVKISSGDTFSINGEYYTA